MCWGWKWLYYILRFDGTHIGNWQQSLSLEWHVLSSSWRTSHFCQCDIYFQEKWQSEWWGCLHGEYEWLQCDLYVGRRRISTHPATVNIWTDISILLNQYQWEEDQNKALLLSLPWQCRKLVQNTLSDNSQCACNGTSDGARSLDIATQQVVTPCAHVQQGVILKVIRLHWLLIKSTIIIQKAPYSSQFINLHYESLAEDFSYSNFAPRLVKWALLGSFRPYLIYLALL